MCVIPRAAMALSPRIRRQSSKTDIQTVLHQRDFCAVNVQFSDQTALHFELPTKLEIRPAQP